MQNLIIPEHISLRREFIPGVGGAELAKLLAVGLPGGGLAIILSRTAGDPFAAMLWMLAAVGWLFLSYALFARFAGRASAWDQLMRRFRFRKEQQDYFYREAEKFYETGY